MSDKGKSSKLAFLIEKYGSLNCLKYFSALLGLKENHILQPLIERWLNEILERLDIPKINKLSIDSHTMFQNLVEELYKESKEDVKLWTSMKNKEVQIELDAFAPVGRNGQLYRTYFDFFDGSTYQIGEVLQFLGILIENFSEKEYKAKFNQFLTRIYTLVDQIHRKHQKLIKESKKELVKVKDVYIPNIEFINHWFSLVTLNYKKNDWIKVIDPLIITIENNSLDYDRRRVDDYLAVQIKDELMFFSPFRVYRCLFKFFISEFYSEFSKNEELEKSVYEYIFNYLFSLLYNLEHFNLVIPFPKVVNKKGEVISSADIGVISDSTKFILINLVNPIESNYFAIDRKTIKPKGGDFNCGKCPSIKDDLKLVWNQEDGKVEEIEIGQIRNSEIFSIFISGLLITDVEIKEKRLPLSFSLYEFKTILSETNSVTFPLFLRARKFAPLYVDHILYFKDELDFFEYSKASFYDFITRDTDFLYLFMNWDMEDWKRRTTRVFQLNPTNLKPIIPFIMQMIEINEFTYQIGYRNQFDKSWVIDISPFKLFISFDQLDYYSELMFLIRVIFNYFSKFNDRIVKLLKENINKNQKIKDFSIEISISDRLTKNIVFCQKGGEKNRISSFVLKIDFGRIVNRKKRRNLIFEVELIGSIISLLIYNKCFNNNIDSEIKDFVSRLTNHKQNFFLTKTYHRGRPPSLEYRPHELPQWVKIRTDNEIARIIRKKRTYPKEITGKELSSFYREISNILQKRVEQIIFKLPKKFLLANFLLELDFLQEKREFDSIQLGYSMKKGVLEDDISDLSKTMNELSIMSISLRHAIETTLSTNNNQSPSFQPNFELYFSIIELCCRRLIYASKSDEIFFNLLDESITYLPK